MFLANELVEIAARAMSPGTNDPFTAINCMDWLSGAFSLLAKREPPAFHQYDDKGKLRMVSNPVTFLTFLHDNINRLRPYVATDRNAALHLQSIYGRLILGTGDKQLQALLIDLDTELLACARDHLGNLDIEKMQARHGVLLELRTGVDANMTLAHQHRWLGGSA
jgi:uncharacterized membrane protein